MEQLDQSLYKKKGDRLYTYTAYPDSKIYEDEQSNDWTQHLLFGDYIIVLDTEIRNERVKVRSRGVSGWIPVDNVQPEKVLEVNFIDIGQGDGCHLVTPDDEHYLIDAGKGDNMFRYLYWRFNLDKHEELSFKFNGIISHPDNDHYLGFREIFKSKGIQFKTIYHSGIVQRPEREELGWNTELGKIEELSDGEKYLLTIVDTDEAFVELLTDEENLSGAGSQYLKTMALVLEQPEKPVFKALNSNSDPLVSSNSEEEVSMELLAPILEEIDGKSVLPYLDNMGKTKNGHSVLIKLKYKKLKIMLGGDINEEAGDYINDKLHPDAKSILQVDVAKACHHGSHHFSYEFIENINALSTIVSSGDDENYSHPRPDTLGALGKTGYSKKPLIFSTELARSNKDFSTATVPDMIKKYQSWEEVKRELHTVKANFVDTPENNVILKDLINTEKQLYKTINSYLTRYGMISLRSDGEKMIITQKLEKDSPSGKYDLYQFVYDEGAQRFVRDE